jgi:hypothetical protein
MLSIIYCTFVAVLAQFADGVTAVNVPHDAGSAQNEWGRGWTLWNHDLIAMHAVARLEAVQYVIKIRNAVVPILSGKVRD